MAWITDSSDRERATCFTSFARKPLAAFEVMQLREEEQLIESSCSYRITNNNSCL